MSAQLARSKVTGQRAFCLNEASEHLINLASFHTGVLALGVRLQ